MRFTNAGTELFATLEGEGEPLLFLHGGLADHRASRPYVQGLPYRLILPDLRGSGRSHFHGELSWELLADDLRALLDALGRPRAIVGGVSMGSGVAVHFALRHPTYVRALWVVAPVYGGGPLEPAQVHALQTMRHHGERAAREGIDALTPLFTSLPPAIRERALAMVRSFDAASVAATTRFLGSLEPPFASLEALSAIEAPTFIVPGQDPEHPPALAEAYARVIPNARVVADLHAATRMT